MNVSNLPSPIQSSILSLLPKKEWWYCERNFKYIGNTIECVKWRPDGKLLAITTYTHSIGDQTNIINTTNENAEQFLNQYINGRSVAWHPINEKLLAIGGKDGDHAKIIDVDQNRIKMYGLLPFLGPIVGWSSKGGFLAGYWSDGKLGIFNVTTGATEKTFNNNIASIAWNPCKNLLATRLMDGRVTFIDMATGQEKLFESIFNVRSIAWHPNGEFLIIGSYDGMIGVIDIVTRETNKIFQFNDTIRSIAWHPNEKCFALALGDTVKVFKCYEKYTLAQQQLKYAFLTWLLIEKPNRKIKTRWQLIADVAFKYELNIQYIFDTWNTFPELLQEALWRTMEYRIQVHGKDVKKRRKFGLFSK